MKKILFPVIAVLICCLYVSCNSSTGGGMSDKAKKNLDNANAIAHMFETGDWSKIGDYIAADGVDHTGMDANGKSAEVKGLDNLKAEFARMGGTMSDMKNEDVKSFADDDYVFQWLKESWTAKTADMGMTPGKRYTMNAIEVSKFNADGKLTDHWSFANVSDMMAMMTPPGNMGGGNMMDTTKMNKMDSSKMKKK